MRAELSANGQAQELPASADTPFKVFSFLPCSRSVKKSTKTCNYAKDTDGVVVIDDSDEEEERRTNSDREYEFLCEIEFDAGTTLPRPIQCKYECKQEPEEQITGDKHSNPTSTNIEQEELSDGEDELLTLCKLEPICDLTETLAAATPNRGDNHYIFFICPQCGDSFDCHSDWRRHILAVHQLGNQQTWNFQRRSNNEFECTKCHLVLTRCTLKALQQHHFTHLPHKVYKCKLCPEETYSLFLMISHIMLHKDREELDATINTKLFGREQSEAMWLHESRAHIAFICPACGITLDDEEAWQAHINFTHNFLEKTAENRFGDHFKCSDCGVEIFSQHISDLQQHLFTHLPYKSFLKCKICNWTISRRNFMLSHILNLHKNNINGRIGSTSTATNKITQEHATDIPANVAEPNNTSSNLNANVDNVYPTNIFTTVNEYAKRSNMPPLVPLQASKQRKSSQTLNKTMPELPQTPPPEKSRKSCPAEAKSDQRQLKCKRALTCEICLKTYYYERSYLKHLSQCKRRRSILETRLSE